MDEHLEQITEALRQCADPTVTDADIADADRIVETVERMLRAKDMQAREIGNIASARDAYLSGMNEARNDLLVARADLDACCRDLGIAQAERDTAMDALTEARKDAAHWRCEADAWQNRYEGMEAALRVALEVCK